MRMFTSLSTARPPRNAVDTAERGDTVLAGSGDEAGVPTLLGRKSLIMGMLTSVGFAFATAAQPSVAAAADAVTYVPKWAPSTAYAPGEQVISPHNDVVAAKIAHTSSASYDTDTVEWALSSTYARRRTFDVMSYGAVGNGTTDDTVAINAAIADAGSNGVVGFPPADYLITSGLTFVEGCVPHMTGTARLIYNGTGTAVTFYRWANLSKKYQGHFRVSVVKTTPAWWGADATSVGVLFANCYLMGGDLPQVQGLATGVSFVADGLVGFGGCSYIDIKLGAIDQNKVGIATSDPNAGYVSALQLSGGRVRLDAIGQSSNVGTRYLTGPILLSNIVGVMLEGAQVEKAVSISGGGNVFHGVSFESVQASGVELTGAGTNMFVGCGSLSHYSDPVLADGSLIAEVIGGNGAHFAASSLTGGKATLELINRFDGTALHTRSADNTQKYVELVNANINIYRGDSQTYPGITLTPNYGGPGNFGGLHLGSGSAAPDVWWSRHGDYPALITDVPIHGTTFYAGNSSAAPKWTSGTGTPEGVVSAAIGSLFSRIDGGASGCLYVKQSGTSNTGWVAK